MIKTIKRHTVLCIRYNAMTRECHKWGEEGLLAVGELKNRFVAKNDENLIKS